MRVTNLYPSSLHFPSFMLEGKRQNKQLSFLWKTYFDRTLRWGANYRTYLSHLFCVARLMSNLTGRDFIRIQKITNWNYRVWSSEHTWLIVWRVSDILSPDTGPRGPRVGPEVEAVRGVSMDQTGDLLVGAMALWKVEPTVRILSGLGTSLLLKAQPISNSRTGKLDTIIISFLSMFLLESIRRNNSLFFFSKPIPSPYHFLVLSYCGMETIIFSRIPRFW